MPSWLGALVMLSGLSNVIYLSPSLATYLSPYYLVLEVGDLALLVYLLAVGVNTAEVQPPSAVLTAK